MAVVVQMYNEANNVVIAVRETGLQGGESLRLLTLTACVCTPRVPNAHVAANYGKQFERLTSKTAKGLSNDSISWVLKWCVSAGSK